jgi:hypothetical protein
MTTATAAHMGRMSDFDYDYERIAKHRRQKMELSSSCRRMFTTHSSPSMARLGRLLAKRFALHDVEYDGNCVCSSVAPAMARRCGHPLTVAEVRRMLVSVLRMQRFRSMLEQDLAQTNRDERSTPLESVDELLDEWSRDSVYLPPLIVATAVAWFTGKRVRVWILCGAVPTVYYRSHEDAHPTDPTVGDFDVELAYDRIGRHMARLVPLDYYETIDRGRQRVLEGLERERKRRRGE